MTHLWPTVVYLLRLLRRAPGFAFVAIAGLTIGIAVALVSTRVMTSLLYGVTPADPLTYAAWANRAGGGAHPRAPATEADPMFALPGE